MSYIAHPTDINGTMSVAVDILNNPDVGRAAVVLTKHGWTAVVTIRSDIDDGLPESDIDAFQVAMKQALAIEDDLNNGGTYVVGEAQQ